ncbi:MFS transporter [Amorphus sp. 3PC139-8]|uniref:MFS transporter n=1 Tax=Amorphus sp. 3PC139-8 TaxID=2735676 RepID=UPI00345D0FF7
MTHKTHLALAGFAATAIAFGPARMGFGLFLPEFRDTFRLTSTVAGLIASSGFLAFLATLPLAAVLNSRLGPRCPVVTGSLSAAIGFATVALASDAVWLTVGVVFAGASAGLCWAPFNDATERVVSEDARSGVLSTVATGTSVGVAGAALLALAVTYDQIAWPASWLAFAVAAALTVAATSAALPAGQTGSDTQGALAGTQALLCRQAVPLYSAALCFGATNAIYLSFAADRVVTAGGLPGLPETAAAAVIFFSYGTVGMLGLMTGRIEAAIGLDRLLRAIFSAAALSLVLIALAPTSWPAVLISSGLHGAALMAVSAVFSFWSLRLFPGRGTLGFTATLIAVAVGSVVGPAIAGVLADSIGSEATFLVAGLPALLTALWPSTVGNNPGPPRAPGRRRIGYRIC